MQALNEKQRRQAFLKFLLFFVLTVALVITAIFFNFDVPLKEINFLQGTIDQQRRVEQSQENFLNTMSEAVILLDSLDRPGVDATQINLQLDPRLSQLASLQQKDMSTLGRLDKAIVDQFFALYRAKLKVQKLADDENQLSKLRSDLNECTVNLQQANAALDGYRRSTSPR